MFACSSVADSRTGGRLGSSLHSAHLGVFHGYKGFSWNVQWKKEEGKTVFASCMEFNILFFLWLGLVRFKFHFYVISLSVVFSGFSLGEGLGSERLFLPDISIGRGH